MSDQPTRKFQKELNAGAVSLVVMCVIRTSKEPMYGYEIAKRLNDMTGNDLPMNQAAIYPVLRSLEKRELLRSRLIPSESGPPRKYYQLTAAGQRAIAEWIEVWKKTTSFVNSVLELDDEAVAETGSDVSGKTRAGVKKKSGRQPRG